MKRLSYINKAVDKVSLLAKEHENLKSMLEEANGDEEMEALLEGELSNLLDTSKQAELACLFSAEVDGYDCFLEVHSGAGGTESHDWAEMLYRMYCRFLERNNFKMEIIDKFMGEEAGIKSATVKITGENAYGWLKTEAGIHRLVRISPFNAAGKRHTSFASIDVYPLLDDQIEVEINESDLRIDTYRASGAGGQHINTTDSAVRITHTPTGIVVQCQNDRSQHRNKEQCMTMLKSRLYEFELRKKEEQAELNQKSKSEIGWGNQIRSYVLHPYQMVKDLRTSHQTSDTDSVLDGDLNDFIYKTLLFKAKGKGLTNKE